MKSFNALFFSILFSLSAFAEGTFCKYPEGATVVKMPITGNQSFNGSTHFKGDGIIPASTNFNNFSYVFFDGEQSINAPLNINTGSELYTNGCVDINYLNLSGGKLYALGSLTIKKLVANGGDIILANTNVLLEIEGKKYCVGDTVKGIKIKVCNTALPVGIVDLKGILKDGKLHVSWKSEDEIGVAVYVVELSEDGNTWHYGGEVAAQQKDSYSTIIDSKVMYGSLAALILLGGVFKRKRYQAIFFVLAAGLAIGCSKSQSISDIYKDPKFLRIKNIDVDKQEGFSKVVKVEKFNL